VGSGGGGGGGGEADVGAVKESRALWVRGEALNSGGPKAS